MNPNNAGTPLRVATGSEVYSSTMAAPHECFDLTGRWRGTALTWLVYQDTRPWRRVSKGCVATFVGSSLTT
jgi:hypothetical protein